jgi:hypothetical protein
VSENVSAVHKQNQTDHLAIAPVGPCINEGWYEDSEEEKNCCDRVCYNVDSNECKIAEEVYPPLETASSPI